MHPKIRHVFVGDFGTFHRHIAADKNIVYLYRGSVRRERRLFRTENGGAVGKPLLYRYKQLAPRCHIEVSHKYLAATHLVRLTADRFHRGNSLVGVKPHMAGENRHASLCRFYFGGEQTAALVCVNTFIILLAFVGRSYARDLHVFERIARKERVSVEYPLRKRYRGRKNARHTRQ